MSTSDLLARRYGPRRRLVCAIDGLPSLIWQDDGTGTPPSRPARWAAEGTLIPAPLDVVALEPPDDELALTLDVGSGTIEPSGISIVLRDVPAPGEPSVRYFSRLFAPGRHAHPSEHSAHLRRDAAGDPYLSATRTTIPTIESLSEWPESGLAYTARETIYYGARSGFLGADGGTINGMTSCVRGLYPCTSISSGTGVAPTYKLPPVPPSSASQTYGQEISTVPFSWLGRRIALHAVAYDDDAGAWRTNPIDAVMVWIGRIDRIRYARGTWVLGCSHILADLERPIAKGLPGGVLNAINLLGPYGLCFTVRARYTSGGYNVVYDSIVSIPSGVYPSHEDVASAVQWFSWNLGTCKILVLPCDDGRYMMRLNNSVGDDATFSIMLYVPDDTTASTTEPRLLTCNPLRALGFTSWQYDSQTLANASSWDVTAEAYPCTAYHPLPQNQNGGVVCVTSAHAQVDEYFWDPSVDASWGDYGLPRAAARISRVALPVGPSDNPDPDSYHYAWYDELDVVNMKRVINGSSTSLSAVTGALVLSSANGAGATVLDQVDMYRPWAHACARVGEPPVQVLNCHVPSYANRYNVTRGPFELLLYMMLSTGTPEQNSSAYDRLPVELAAGIDADLVDVTSFLLADAVIAANPLAKRLAYIIDEPTTMRELLERECSLFGFAVTWSAADGKIRLVDLYHAAPATNAVVIGDSTGTSPTERPDVEYSVDTVINRWEVSCVYDRTTRKYRAPIVVEDEDSIAQLSTAKTVKIKHPGIYIKEGTIVETVEQIVSDVLLGRRTMYRYPSGVFEHSLNPTQVGRVSVGDVVSVVTNRLPDPHGSGEMSVASPALVIGVATDLSTWTARATLLMWSWGDMARVAPWGMAAIATAWSPSNYRLTLAPLSFGASGDADDGSAFSAGDVVDIFARDGSAAWTGRVVASAYETDGSNILTLEATTLSGWVSGAEYVVVASEYASVTTSQRTRNTFMGSGPSIGSSPAYRWG